VSHTLRRISTLVGAAAAMMAISATPAFAAPVDFPHEAKTSAWTGIKAYDWNGNAAKAVECGKAEAQCSFEDTAMRKGWAKVFGIVANSSIECTVTGELLGDGDVKFTMPFEGNGCELFATGKTAPEICRHDLLNEYWLRIPLGGTLGGVVFGHLALTEQWLFKSTFPTFFARGVEFGDFEDNVYTSTNPSSSASFISADYDDMWDAGQVLIGKSVEGDGCDWPELS